MTLIKYVEIVTETQRKEEREGRTRIYLAPTAKCLVLYMILFSFHNIVACFVLIIRRSVVYIKTHQAHEVK